jgi:polyisoprenyl-teichoic acid--peptidoglycan teichoic acid transferase
MKRTAAWVSLTLAASGLAACSPGSGASAAPPAIESIRPSAAAPAPSPTATPSADPWVGKRRLNVLILGSDGGPDRHGERTDVVIVASIDTRTGNTALIGVPRNLQHMRFRPGTRMAHRYPNGFPDFMFGIYTYAAAHREVLPGSDPPAADLLKQTIGYNLGVKIDYYALVNMRGFRDIIKAIGGVNIRVAEPLLIGSGGRYLTPRLYRDMSSYNTLWYARSRKNTTDYSRMARQRCVLAALVRQASPRTLMKALPKLMHAGGDSLRTDIPRRLLPAMATLALRVGKAEIKGITLGPPLINGAYPDWGTIRRTVDEAISTSADASRRPGRAKTAVRGGKLQSTDAVCRFS